MASSSAPIHLYNRQAQRLETETVFKGGIMDWLYGGWPGKVLVNTLVKRRWFSRGYEWLQQRRRSQATIARFVADHHIDVSELSLPLEQYQSFEHFFIREFKPGARPISQHPNDLIAPAESRMKVIPLHRQTLIPVKGRRFTLNALLRNSEWARRFENGTCLSFRLAPADHHRFIYFDDLNQGPITPINGVLHSVSPLSLRQMHAVFTQNVREYCVMDTAHFGEVIHVDVGALTVGRITQHHRCGHQAKRGEEKGYFQLGGSSILLLFQAGQVRIDDDILNYSQQDIETRVRLGEVIGKRASKKTTTTPPLQRRNPL